MLLFSKHFTNFLQNIKLKFLPAVCDFITIYYTRSMKQADAWVQVNTTDTFLYLFCPIMIKSAQDRTDNWDYSVATWL